jgi:hypothetical protein
MTERYGLFIDNTSFFNSRRGVKGIADNRTGYKYIGFENVLNLLNQSTDELMDLRAENTKLKFVLKDVIEDLEKQAETKEPIIISKKYVKWIKKESGLPSIMGDDE